MMIGVSEGQGWRYEVDEDPDGYLVRMCDLATGAVEIGEARLFRTAAVAFAYAELSAAFDRYAAARIDGSGGAAALLAVNVVSGNHQGADGHAAFLGYLV